MDAPQGSTPHMVDQKKTKVMVTMPHQISLTVIVVCSERRLFSAISDTSAVWVVVVWFTEDASESLTDQTTLFVVMYQVIVHLGGRNPLRIYDAII